LNSGTRKDSRSSPQVQLPSFVLDMAVDAGAIVQPVLITAPPTRVGIDFVRKDSVALDADGVAALIVAGGAVDNLPARDAAMEVR